MISKVYWSIYLVVFIQFWSGPGILLTDPRYPLALCNGVLIEWFWWVAIMELWQQYIILLPHKSNNHCSRTFYQNDISPDCLTRCFLVFAMWLRQKLGFVFCVFVQQWQTVVQLPLRAKIQKGNFKMSAKVINCRNLTYPPVSAIPRGMPVQC